MKELFGKILKAEGNIESGDRYFDSRNGVFESAVWNSDFEELNSTTPSGNRIYSKMKLVLCSRDVQLDDTVLFESHPDFGEKTVVLNDGGIITLHDGNKTGIQNLIKVIGEISPCATWVKDGDVFAEAETRLSGFLKSENSEFGWHNNSYAPYSEEDLKSYDKWKNFIKIMCPICKKFH